MCTSQWGVGKQIDVEAVSKDIGRLIKILDKEIQQGDDNVNLPVKDIKAAAKKLEKLVE
jgi:uncharacterized protein with von Willebrand factor type A (vWA) domain